MRDTVTLIAGKISRLTSDVEDTVPVVRFRVGGILCRATAGLALVIIGARGFPGHMVNASGAYDGKVLAVDKLDLLD